VKQRLDWILAGAICLLAGALIWTVSGTLEAHVTEVGETAPNFKVTSDSGKSFTRDDFGGKVLVLNFWASWCAPCVDEIPSLNEFARQFGPKGVVVLGISIDRNEKLYKRFIERYKVPFATMRDPEAVISGNYGTFQIPETYIIDRSGKVVEKIISNQNWMDPDFLARIRRML
jgi:cytochrome c biogenesis protein CcmG, thiol:disulfide interchange protein DsbE